MAALSALPAAAGGGKAGGGAPPRPPALEAGDGGGEGSWACSQCTFENPGLFLRCGVCSSQRDSVRPDDVAHSDQFARCPAPGCSQYIQLMTPGFVERCDCPCGLSFCSMCRGRFHGIPRPLPSAREVAERSLGRQGAGEGDQVAGALGPPAGSSSGGGSSSSSSSSSSKQRPRAVVEDRLTCQGAERIADAWTAWLLSSLDGSEPPLTPRSATEKHHVDLSQFLDVTQPDGIPQLYRENSSEYRLKCGVCYNDIIGPRFSCIHCVAGLECCMACAQDRAAQVAHHDASHCFQIYFEDEFPDQMQSYVRPNVRCPICMSEEDQEDILFLESCRHSAHAGCLEGQLNAKWSGKAITFNYLTCGECRTPLQHIALAEALLPHYAYKEKVEAMCLAQCREDGLIEGLEELFVADPLEAVALCARTMKCLVCSSCTQPFCGGRIDCGEDASLDLTTLRCPPCAFDMEQRQAAGGEGGANWRGKCRQHGYKHAIYKCDSCCSVATWDCRSNHYCQRCHGNPNSPKDYKCPGLATCPLGIPHPPNGPGVHGQVDKGFVIGCARCFAGSEELVLQTDSSAEGGVEHWRERFNED